VCVHMHVGGWVVVLVVTGNKGQVLSVLFLTYSTKLFNSAPNEAHAIHVCFIHVDCMFFCERYRSSECTLHVVQLYVFVTEPYVVCV